MAPGGTSTLTTWPVMGCWIWICIPATAPGHGDLDGLLLRHLHLLHLHLLLLHLLLLHLLLLHLLHFGRHQRVDHAVTRRVYADSIRSSITWKEGRVSETGYERSTQ